MSEIENEIIHRFRDNIICPYCGKEHTIEASINAFYKSEKSYESDFDFTCDKCGKYFSVYASIKFTSEKETDYS